MILRMPKAVRLALGLVAGLAIPAVAGDPAVPTTAAEAPRVTAAELKKMVENGEVVIVDVRAREAWEAGHIAGAVHIPLTQLSSRLGELPKAKKVVAYCT